MTFVARTERGEAEARLLAEAASEDAQLSWPTVARSEIAPGRWSVEVYFPAPPEESERMALDRLAGSAGAFAITHLPDIDWVAKSLEGLAPVHAGRFVVYGAHDRDQPRRNDIAVEIEAGEAFGTGHHGTTAGCLREIDRLGKIRRFRRPLDVGTGSGVLAIAMAKLWHVPVLATDIDPVAVRVARGNARLNGTPQVRAAVAGGLGRRVVRDAAPFDLIVANILAGPLQAMARSVERVLAGDGVVVLSGLLPEQRARIVAAYRTVGLVLLRASELDGWLTLTFGRKI
ncbi:MAG: 50S ribosomal protein L11 methyltransferase [Bauldia sp.]